MNKEIDRIVEAFIPEMARISGLNESEAQKERHAKTWLRTTLDTFARRIMEENQGQCDEAVANSQSKDPH